MKTLKDLEYTIGSQDLEKHHRPDVVESKELRELARKWKKELLSKENLNDYTLYSGNKEKPTVDVLLDTEEIVTWIDHFFNLGDEDER